MADTRTSRGPVPIALGSAASGTEEGRGFFQTRLALFGKFVFLISGSFLAVSMLEQWGAAAPSDAVEIPIGHPSLYHLCGTLVAGTLWVVARQQRRLSARAVEWLDAIGSTLMCAFFVLMGVGFAQALLAAGQDPVQGLFTGLLACSYVVLSRAIALPSTPRRTLAVSGLAMAILPIATLAGTGVLSAVFGVAEWSLAAVALAVVASRVIFGLRAEVDKGRRLGQYTLEDKLGEGGMGVVYRASHAMLRRPTAIKMLRSETAGEDTLRRFEREVQLTASLSHPSTVAIFDYGRTPQGLFYYAMEYLDGLNLEQLVRADGPQPPARVVHILRQVCGALAEAHGVGLIHRDVKPANIILSERGGMPDVAKVVDFGLVKSFETTGSPVDIDVTSANVLVGTPLYMSPEAINGHTAHRATEGSLCPVLVNLTVPFPVLLSRFPLLISQSRQKTCLGEQITLVAGFTGQIETVAHVHERIGISVLGSFQRHFGLNHQLASQLHPGCAVPGAFAGHQQLSRFDKHSGVLLQGRPLPIVGRWFIRRAEDRVGRGHDHRDHDLFDGGRRFWSVPPGPPPRR